MTKDTTTLLASKQPAEHRKQDSAKHWLTRHLLRPVTRQTEQRAQPTKPTGHLPLYRPRTAPSIRPCSAPSWSPTATYETAEQPPMPSLQRQQLTFDHNHGVVPPSLRPGADVLLDVDAWLATSKPSSPLMGGLSYWREGAPADGQDTGSVQYAIPIIQGPSSERPETSHGQQLWSLCRRAKKQVRIPSIRREKSPRAIDEDGNGRSESAPVLAVEYEQTRPGEIPFFFPRPATARPVACTPTAAVAASYAGGFNESTSTPHAGLWLRGGIRSSTQLRETECDMAQTFTHGPLTGSTLRPGALAAEHLPREDSMGSFSSAPTYFSGVPPPSYKSRPESTRPASIITTSSFGCIDGMNPEQRQLSQKRAAEKQRTVKGRLRKLAKRANIRK